jgi:hypothetical protein
MRLRSESATQGFVILAGAALFALGSGCDDGGAPKAWSALSACLQGNAEVPGAAERVHRVRLIQLANSAPNPEKTGWPARCATHADELYAALGGGSETAVLRRKLSERLNCSETKGSCALTNDASLASAIVELTEAARSVGLKLEPAPNVPAPEVGPEPALDQKGWKSFSDAPLALLGPELAPDGRALALLKALSGRARPKSCEFAPGLGKVSCSDADPKVPELPVQSIELVVDPAGSFAAGLTEEGLFAFNLKTGEKSAVRGASGRLVQSGVAVEKGATEDPKKKPAAAAEPPKEPVKDKYVAVELNRGKAGRELTLPVANPAHDPIQVGRHAVWLERGEGGVELVIKSVSQGGVKDALRAKGAFSGAFHTCASGDDLAVATWAPHKGQHGAKPTVGATQTQLAITLFKNGAWSKPAEATLPFDRGIESDLVCTKAGASLAWARSVVDGVMVARLDCTADGCKPSEVKLPAVESKWWWAVGPVGDKVLLAWRSGLGESRLRVAPIAGLAAAKDVIFFDSPDFGGPNAGQLKALFSEGGALLVFKDAQPVAVHVSTEGTPRVLTQ